MVSFRENEHSTLLVAWFVSELAGGSVFAKQLPDLDLAVA